MSTNVLEPEVESNLSDLSPCSRSPPRPIRCHMS